MIDFLRTYWRVILEFIFLVISLVMFIVRKRPVKIVDSVKSLVYGYLPEVINRVELYSNEQVRTLSGPEKLTMALCMVSVFLTENCGFTEDDLRLNHPWIKEAIENILSTPQKKGEKVDA